MSHGALAAAIRLQIGPCSVLLRESHAVRAIPVLATGQKLSVAHASSSRSLNRNAKARPKKQQDRIDPSLPPPIPSSSDAIDQGQVVMLAARANDAARGKTMRGARLSSKKLGSRAAAEASAPGTSDAVIRAAAMARLSGWTESSVKNLEDFISSAPISASAMDDEAQQRLGKKLEKVGQLAEEAYDKLPAGFRQMLENEVRYIASTDSAPQARPSPNLATEFGDTLKKLQEEKLPASALRQNGEFSEEEIQELIASGEVYDDNQATTDASSLVQRRETTPEEMSERLEKYSLQQDVKRASTIARQATGTITLPEELVRAQRAVLKEHHRLMIKDASTALNTAYHRHIGGLQKALHYTPGASAPPIGRESQTPDDNGGDKSASAKKNRVENVPSPFIYREREAVGYVASRLTGPYGSNKFVFDELASRVPSFKPQSMLDFGSGPGTSMWAARSVWKDGLGELCGVEPSAGMFDLARDMFRGIDGVKHKRTLAELQGQQFDLVTASYVLNEIPTEKGRKRALRSLWEHTKDILVLIEPGTPLGFQMIRAARQLILDEYPPDSDENGSHVVAPCPHDKRCPLEHMTDGWCHFSQRVNRVPGQVTSRDAHQSRFNFEDEKFSYVVLRRGRSPRSAAVLATTSQPLTVSTLPQPVRADTPLRSTLVEISDGKSDDDGVGTAVLNNEKVVRPANVSAHPEQDSSSASKFAPSSYIDQAYGFDDSDMKTGSTQVDGNLFESLNSVRDHAISEPVVENGRRRLKWGGRHAAVSRKAVSGSAEVNSGEPVRNAFDVDSNLDDIKENVLSPEFEREKYVWSRIVDRPVFHRKHLTMKLCTSEGDINHLTLTKHKHPWVYRVARRLRWGDLWPYSGRTEGREHKDN